MKSREGGYTLAEVIISMLLVAMMVGAVYRLALTSMQSGNKIDRKVFANQAERHLSEQLRQYVTADSTTNLIAGPNGGTGATAWYMQGSASPQGGGVTVIDSLGAVYALASGTHNLHNYLPQWFEAAPYNATAQYVVTPQAGLGNGTPVNINVTVIWTEP